MQNLSDNELDNRFKEAADNYRPPFDQGAWQDMQNRLDKIAIPEKKFFIKPRWLFPLVFLLGSITGIVSWNFLSNNQNTTPLYDSEQDRYTMDHTDKISDIQNIENIESSVTAQDQNTNPKQTHTNVPSSNKDTRVIPSMNNNDQFSSIAPGDATHDLSSLSVRTSTPKLSTSFITQENTTLTVTNPDPGFSPWENDNVKETNSSAEHKKHTHHVIAESNEEILDSPDSTHNGDGAEQNTPANTVQEKKRNLDHRLSVSVGISPDFSTVGFRNSTRSGSNYGVFLEYHITPKLSVQSGAILSTKIYNALNIEYNGYRVPKAEGECRILDLPLNIYYRFNPGARVSFFTSAGISSYLMAQEDYTFYYDSYGGQKKYYKQVKGENKEWFSVLNVSAGITRQIGSGLFVEAEPFVKVPFSGIGDGKLNVNSLGLFVRLRYSFLKN
jgi:hypothetical protein